MPENSGPTPVLTPEMVQALQQFQAQAQAQTQAPTGRPVPQWAYGVAAIIVSLMGSGVINVSVSSSTEAAAVQAKKDTVEDAKKETATMQAAFKEYLETQVEPQVKAAFKQQALHTKTALEVAREARTNALAALLLMEKRYGGRAVGLALGDVEDEFGEELDELKSLAEEAARVQPVFEGYKMQIVEEETPQ